MSFNKSWVEEEKEKVRNHPEALVERYFIDITEQVLAYMEENGIKKSELAERMDVTKGYVSKLFADNTNLTLLTLAKISKALDISWKFERINAGPIYPDDGRLQNDLPPRRKKTGDTVTTESGDAPETKRPYLLSQQGIESKGNQEGDKIQYGDSEAEQILNKLDGLEDSILQLRKEIQDSREY